MKIKHSPTTFPISVVAAAAIFVLGCNKNLAQDAKSDPAAQPAAAQPAAVPVAAPSFTDAQLAEEWGWFLGKQAKLSDLGLTPDEVEAFVKGLGISAGGKDAPIDPKQIGPAMSKYVQAKQKASQERLHVAQEQARQVNLAASDAYFNKLRENKSVVELPSGLRYEILKAGTGNFPKATDTVRVNYTGTLLDGTVFDATSKHPGAQPSEFPLNGVIPGWTEGIQKINKGGTIRLHIPSNLAYGDHGNQSIPPGSTLIFEVELLDIVTPPAPAAKP